MNVAIENAIELLKTAAEYYEAGDSAQGAICNHGGNYSELARMLARGAVADLEIGYRENLHPVKLIRTAIVQLQTQD